MLYKVDNSRNAKGKKHRNSYETNNHMTMRRDNDGGGATTWQMAFQMYYGMVREKRPLEQLSEKRT